MTSRSNARLERDVVMVRLNSFCGVQQRAARPLHEAFPGRDMPPGSSPPSAGFWQLVRPPPLVSRLRIAYQFHHTRHRQFGSNSHFDKAIGSASRQHGGGVGSLSNMIRLWQCSNGSGFGGAADRAVAGTAAACFKARRIELRRFRRVCGRLSWILERGGSGLPNLNPALAGERRRWFAEIRPMTERTRGPWRRQSC